MYLLEFTEGPKAGKKLIFRKKTVLVGRNEESDLMLEGDEISREHAEIELRNQRAFLRDLGAVNHALLNGHAVSESELKDDDVVRIGPHQFTFRLIHPPMPMVKRPPTFLHRMTGGAIGVLLTIQMAFLVGVSVVWRENGLTYTEPAGRPVAAKPDPKPAAKPAPPPVELAQKPEPRVPTAAEKPVPARPDPAPAPVKPQPEPAEVAGAPKPVPAPVEPAPAKPIPAVPTPTPPADVARVEPAPPKPMPPEIAPKPAPEPAVPPAPVVADNPPPKPDPFQTAVNQAAAQFQSGDFIAAGMAIDQALKQNPRNAEALALQARIFDRLGKFKEASAAWTAAKAASESSAIQLVAAAEIARLDKMLRLLNQSQAMADRIRQEERTSPLQNGVGSSDPNMAVVQAPVVRKTPPEATAANPAPRAPPPSRLGAKSVVLDSAQIERLVGSADVEDMRMLTITLRVDPSAGPLRGEDVRIRTVFYDRDRRSQGVEASTVRVPEANVTLTGNLQPDELVSLTRPYVVPAGMRRAQQQRAGKDLSFHGFMVEIYYKDRLLQQYARPSSLLGN